MIPNFTIGSLMIDSANAKRARDFYVDVLGLEKITAFGCPAFKADNGFVIAFLETDIPHVPPVWPEEVGKEQKQMHLDFGVDDLPSAVEEAIRLGGTKAEVQFGGDDSYYVTMLDPDGHPFCLCQKSPSESPSGRVLPDVSINIDCQKQQVLREFYAQLTGWELDFHWAVLIADNGMIVCFQGCDNDATMDEYVPPVWPEEPGKQQKQMYFIYHVDDLQSAVEEAIRLGAVKPAQQDDEQAVMLIDTEGHSFCLCTPT